MSATTGAAPQLSRAHWHGTPVWEILAQAARARISAFGGQLLSWLPDGTDEVLWLSPQLAPLPTPIRGGGRCAGRGSDARARMHPHMGSRVPRRGSCMRSSLCPMAVCNWYCVLLKACIPF